MAGSVIGASGDAQHDRKAVAVGLVDKTGDDLARAHRLFIHRIARRLGSALLLQLRHVGDELGIPDAPHLARIAFVAAFEPFVEKVDGDAFAVLQAPLHGDQRKGVHRLQLILREVAQLAFDARRLGPADGDDHAGDKRQHANAGDGHEPCLQGKARGPQATKSCVHAAIRAVGS
jgi:hypothetical protein